MSGAGIAVVSFGNSAMTATPTATSGYVGHGTPMRCGSCDMSTMIASALTNPTMTLRGMNRNSFATPKSASRIWKTPASRIVASRYSTPWVGATSATTSATAPVAAEIIAARPPTNAIDTAMTNELKRPTRGSTPAMIENAIASGMSASATARPARTSRLRIRGERSAPRTVGRSAVRAALMGSPEIGGKNGEAPFARSARGDHDKPYRNVRVCRRGDPVNAPRTMHIGEVAERTGLSLRTLRHYDEVGLVTPSDRTDAGYRLYTDVDLERILLIRRMKPLGFSLEQMGEVLAAHDALEADPADRDARAALDSFVADAEERRAKLARQLDAAEELI